MQNTDGTDEGRPLLANHTADIIDYTNPGTGTDAYKYIDKETSPYKTAAGEKFDDRDYAGKNTFPELDAATSFPYTQTFRSEADKTVKVPAWLDDPTRFYYFTLMVVTAFAWALWVIVHSAFGRILAATRENPLRAEFIGVHVKRVQLVAFVISGGVSGVAGALYSVFNRSVFVETAWWTMSAEVLIMAVLGGMHSFFGPAVGAAALPSSVA